MILKQSKMKRLPKDILVKTALELSPSDLINLCVAEKDMYKNICNSKDFWRLKLERDYLDPKNEYMKEFTFVSKNIEDALNKIIETIKISIRRNFLNYIDFDKYKKDTYDFIYKKYNEIDFEELKEQKYDIYEFSFTLPAKPDNGCESCLKFLIFRKVLPTESTT